MQNKVQICLEFNLLAVRVIYNNNNNNKNLIISIL